jgi:mannose-1-phosphate guanylyltransferase/mannose-6-phosphate isomerase
MRILLLAGGSGTRLWPLSSEQRPKQFLPVLTEKSLLAETWARVAPLAREIFVATAERHVALVRAELGGIPPDRILAESVRRNSGPAILSAALAFADSGDPVTAAVPSDQTAADPEAFRRALQSAEALADSASVVVLAVPPTRPESDFGYLEVTDAVAEGGLDVLRFTEKPGVEEARGYVSSGRHFWNAGIFVFRPSRFLAEARRVAAELVAGVEAYRRRLAAGDASGARRAYEALPSISIDYAVMERAAKVRAVPLRAGWSDVGTWSSVRELRGASDERGNLIVSDVPVLAPGVRDSAIIVGREGVLVLPFEREGELRGSVERLRLREEAGRAAG